MESVSETDISIKTQQRRIGSRLERTTKVNFKFEIPSVSSLEQSDPKTYKFAISTEIRRFQNYSGDIEVTRSYSVRRYSEIHCRPQMIRNGVRKKNQS